jgi:hypothetical protein
MESNITDFAETVAPKQHQDTGALTFMLRRVIFARNVTGNPFLIYRRRQRSFKNPNIKYNFPQRQCYFCKSSHHQKWNRHPIIVNEYVCKICISIKEMEILAGMGPVELQYPITPDDSRTTQTITGSTVECEMPPNAKTTLPGIRRILQCVEMQSSPSPPYNGSRKGYQYNPGLPLIHQYFKYLK